MKPWTITTIPPDRWRLTPAETNVMDSMVEHGQITLVAGDLGLAYDTVQQHVWHARKKMGAPNVVRASVAWDRYSRERA